MASMFDVMCQLAEKQYECLKGRTAAEDGLFQDFIVPFHAEAERVSHDYVRFFQNLEAALDSDGWADAVEDLKRRGAGMRLNRRELAGKVKAVEEVLADRQFQQSRENPRLAAAREFVGAVGGMFSLGTWLDRDDAGAEYPSLAAAFPARSTADRVGTPSVVLLDVYDLLAHQERHGVRPRKTGQQREELTRFVRAVTATQMKAWEDASAAYARLQLLVKDPMAALRDRWWRL